MIFVAKKKQDAGPTPELYTPNNSEEKVDALQPEGSKKRKVLITNNILHKQDAGLTPELQTSNNSEEK